MKQKIITAITQIRKEWYDHKIWIIVAGAIMLFFVYYARYKAVEPSVYEKVPEIKEVVKKKIKKVNVPTDTGNVAVLDKGKITEYVKGLPEDFATNPKKQATSTAAIPPSEAGHDVINVIDTGTGVSEMIAKERKLPFMALENKGEAGIRAGVSEGGKAVDIYAQQNFLRVGNFHVGGYAEGSYKFGDNEIGYKAMIAVCRKW